MASVESMCYSINIGTVSAPEETVRFLMEAFEASQTLIGRTASRNIHRVAEHDSNFYTDPESNRRFAAVVISYCMGFHLPLEQQRALSSARLQDLANLPTNGADGAVNYPVVSAKIYLMDPQVLEAYRKKFEHGVRKSLRKLGIVPGRTPVRKDPSCQTKDSVYVNAVYDTEFRAYMFEAVLAGDPPDVYKARSRRHRFELRRVRNLRILDQKSDT